MPLSPAMLETMNVEAIMASITDNPGTVYLHTISPIKDDLNRGRTTTGGGAYEDGLSINPNDWTREPNGDATINIPLDFGKANDLVGHVRYYTYWHGGECKFAGMLPAGVIVTGSTLEIKAYSLRVECPRFEFTTGPA